MKKHTKAAIAALAIATALTACSPPTGGNGNPVPPVGTPENPIADQTQDVDMPHIGGTLPRSVLDSITLPVRVYDTLPIILEDVTDTEVFYFISRRAEDDTSGCAEFQITATEQVGKYASTSAVSVILCRPVPSATP